MEQHNIKPRRSRLAIDNSIKHLHRFSTLQQENEQLHLRRNTLQLITQQQQIQSNKPKPNKPKSMFTIKENNVTVKETCCSKFKAKMNYIMDLPVTIILMSCLTLFALYGSDIQTAWCPPSVDFAFDIVQLFIFIMFTLEITLSTIVDPSYGLSLFFWLDIVSTLSLFLDVNFISDHFLGKKILLGNAKFQYQLTLAKISTASGTTRVLRILRIIKLIRIVKLYKAVYQAKQKMAKDEESKNQKIKKMLLSNNNMNQSSSAGNNNNQSNIQVMELIEKQIQNDNNSIGAKNSTTAGMNSTLSKTKVFHIADNKLKTNDKDDHTKNELGKVTKINDITDDTLKESRITKVITDSLNKKVFYLVMIVLLIYPLLSEDFYFSSTDNISYSILSSYLETYHSINPSTFDMHSISYITSSYDPFFPIINITLNNNSIYTNPNSKITSHNYRTDEIRTFISPNGHIAVTFSVYKETSLTAMLNFFRTLFICILVAISVWLIEGDAKRIVLEPLEIIMEIFDKIIKDPVNAKNVQELQSGVKATIDKYGNVKKEKNYELKVIKRSILEISGLLSMGFGEVGAGIIKRKLVNEEYEFKEKGKNVIGIYGVFSINNYEIINKRFKKNSIILFNHIASIFHESVNLFSGNITKNIDENIYAIWKFNPKTFSLISSSSNVPSNEDISLLVENITSLSLLSCLRTLNKIQKRSNSFFIESQCKANIGIALHLGFSIEGVVGSSLKIDTVHLGKNTFITEQLNSATLYYGVEIIFTEAIYVYLSEALKEFCRCIDIVYFASNSNNVKLYTIDVNTNVNVSDKEIMYLNRYEKELLFKEKKKKLYEGINSVGNVSEYILGRCSFQEILKTECDDEFYDTWKEGIERYIEGEWRKAKECFEKCLDIKKGDGPAKRLIEYMEEFDFKVPGFWEGARPFPCKV